MSTIFSQILAGEAEASFVYRDDLVSAFLDIQPVTPGHTLVVPNRPAANLAELDDQIAGHLFNVARRVAAAIRKTDLRCEGINLFLADGEAAGQDIFHAHLHVVPRFPGDGFGFRFDDSYFDLPPRKELDRVAAAIRQVM